MVFEFKKWLLERWKPSPALSRMRLGPEGSTANPLMVGILSEVMHLGWLKYMMRFNFLRGTATTMKWAGGNTSKLKFRTLRPKGLLKSGSHLPTKLQNHVDKAMMRMTLYVSSAFHHELPLIVPAVGPWRIWSKRFRRDSMGYQGRTLTCLQCGQTKSTWHLDWCRAQCTGVECYAFPTAHLNVYSFKHKLGADRNESFLIVPVDPKNRLKDIGPTREIEVSSTITWNSCYVYMYLRSGFHCVWFLRKKREGNSEDLSLLNILVIFLKHSGLRWDSRHFTGRLIHVHLSMRWLTNSRRWLGSADECNRHISNYRWRA